ncbi:Uncharacterised protein [Klebsiella pneumoniae]|nr:Uncharacterised protein [Klebsiella pneumoniae]
MADNRLIVLEVGNAEVAQQRGAFEARAAIQRHHLGTIGTLRHMAMIGHHHGRAGIALRPHLRQEHVVKGVAFGVLDKQHRLAIARLLELPGRECSGTRVGFGVLHHFALIARGPRPEEANVDRCHQRGKQHQDHRRLHQHAFA